MSHEEEADVVAAHEVDEFVVFLFGQVGGWGGAVVVRGAEEAGVGVDHHVAILVALLQELFEPVELPAAVGGVAAVEEDEEVFGTADGLHGDGVGGGVEILLEILLAVEVDVVVADGDEAGVGGLGQPEQAVELSERPRAALVGYVAIDDAEEAEGVGVFVAQELFHTADVALEVDVGADVDVVLVGCVGDDDGGVLVVPFEPLGHAVFGVGAAGEEHACHIEAVAGGESQRGEEDEVSGFHWHWVLKGASIYQEFES